MKPILFNTEMVRTILDGRKTVTRRVIKPRYRDDECGWTVCINSYSHLVDDVAYTDGDGACTRSMKPPYQVGNILYVRETWREYNGKYFFKANEPKEYDDYKTSPKWKPSIHMPKEAARIFLKVTDVRVERLQDMKTVDFQKEGMQANSIPDWWNIIEQKFRKLWDSTVPKKDLEQYGWDANPWVWVIEFERFEKGGENVQK